MSLKQMSYCEFSREIGRSVADCFDGPAAPIDENTTRHQRVRETLAARKEELMGGEETTPETQGSLLLDPLEVLQKLWR